MPKPICLLLVFLGAALWPQRLFAGDEISRILQSWSEHYGAFAKSDQYHYRCVSTRRCKAPDPSFDRLRLGKTFELGLEIFRLGRAWRMHAIAGGDFSDFSASAETRIFDGRAGILSQRQAGGSRFFQIYPANHDLETVRERVEPYADPLADVLGLSVDASTASWALGVPPDRKPFDLAAALVQGTLHLVSQDAERTELRDAQGNELRLSVQHNYALVRRTWTWTLGTTLNCSLENRGWKQFGNGTWYPQVSKFICSRRSGADSEEELLTVEYRFSAQPACKPSDFEVTADRPGTDLEYHGPGKERRARTLKAGERIDLTRLAHNQLSIRWDTRDLPYSLMEKWSGVPLMAIAMFLAIQHATKGRVQRGGYHPERAIWLSLLVGAMFLFLIHLAMWLYQGGAKSDKALTCYSWTLNYLSDLGREYRYDDGDNHPVNIVFTLALCFAGAATTLYAWQLPHLFRRSRARGFATLAAVCGLTAGWCYIRIGLAPVDSYRDEHHFYETVGFIAWGIMGLFYATALLLASDYPRRYGWSLLAFCLLLGAFVLLRQVDGPHWRSASSLSWRATAQKIVVYSQALCMTIQAVGGLQWLKRQSNGEVP
ncbi:MAG TPA: DUF998 domain-containing protein [Pirellulales bacterium]|nr:DUF998 domain-containing protein [Pirellulales bacterium]